MKQILQIIGFLVFIIALSVILSGCKTQSTIHYPQSTNHTDSVRVSVVHDSVRVYERDSVFIDRFVKADTIWLTTEKWSIRYRDREVVKHDTIYQAQKETEVVQVKYTPPFYKRCTAAFFGLLVGLLLIIAIRIVRIVTFRR